MRIPGNGKATNGLRVMSGGKAAIKGASTRLFGIIEALPNNPEWNYSDKVGFCLPSLNLQQDSYSVMLFILYI